MSTIIYPCPIEPGKGHKTCPAQIVRASGWSTISFLHHRDLQGSNRGCSVHLGPRVKKSLGRGAADHQRQEQEWDGNTHCCKSVDLGLFVTATI